MAHTATARSMLRLHLLQPMWGSDVRMTLMRYLLEYTLETVCHGNWSECARRMGMEYAELRKFRKRMSEGSGSSRVTEALLEMYWREGLSVDAAFAQYTKTRFGTDIENAERMCDKIVKTARENLRMEKYNAQKTADLLKAVYEFVEQTQRCFCESICQRERYQDSPCPVKQLVEFINWLEKELDVLCQAPKRNGSVDGNRDESMANHWDKHH